MVFSFNGLVLVTLIVGMSSLMVAYGGRNFHQDFDITWGDQRAKISNGGQLLSLSLDKTSSSGFRSKQDYCLGGLTWSSSLLLALLLPTMYLSSGGPTHDAIDFEFLGNLSGDPYIVHTNVFTQGKGNREQQFYLWFDPTKNFHTYSIVWNTQQIIFLVDNTPIRVFKNAESIGVPFPKTQPMRIYSSLWNADDWATRGCLAKTDWTKAPFTAYYRNFNFQTCSSRSCTSSSTSNGAWKGQELDAYSRRRLRWVQKNFMIYNYCTDLKRFPQGLPPECR
ncbi:xyloglucan endotransglucosylase/hydrolase 15 [Actinidia rufa]|uniref:Xyloglucan endotransglucosylase/hydrolase n=1 Tax=Actinidia rufa TaxID=165716 RepID=A0A7J0F2S6_9ERIC|nr:xyloglucan endotransglucosylase/hydrolase 15 [Actinidia rufa]